MPNAEMRIKNVPEELHKSLYSKSVFARLGKNGDPQGSAKMVSQTEKAWPGFRVVQPLDAA